MLLDVIVSGAGLGGECGVTPLYSLTRCSHTELIPFPDMVFPYQVPFETN